MKHLRLLPTLILALVVTVPAGTASAEGCSGFKWPLDTEIGWLNAGDDVTLKSGDEMPETPAKAIALTLQPAKSVTMPVAAGVKPQAVSADSFSGWFNVAKGVKPGLYQVSLSTNGWIDVIQNGKLVPSKGFTGRQECKAIHKSVRYEIGEGPLSIQISGAPAETVRLTIRAAK
jgi:hypothetical protein